MRALLQRVSKAAVEVDGERVAQIAHGLLVFVGIGKNDTHRDCSRLALKIGKLRIFSDTSGKMNENLQESGGALLVVSQFTLYADTRKGNRPSYSDAATAIEAKPLYEHFLFACREAGYVVQSGIFQANMRVTLVNEGPVTFLCSSE